MRNLESHGEYEAFVLSDLRWRDDFLRIASAICDFIGADLNEILGEGFAGMATDLIARDDQHVQAEVARLIAEARVRDAGPAATAGPEEIRISGGAITREVACPACANQAYVTGWTVGTSEPVIRNGDVIRRLTVATQSFACAHCGLELGNRPLLVAAGLPGVFETTASVDPYEALGLDPTEEVERMGLIVVDPSWEPDFDDIGD